MWRINLYQRNLVTSDLESFELLEGRSRSHEDVGLALRNCSCARSETKEDEASHALEGEPADIVADVNVDLISFSKLRLVRQIVK